LVGDVNQSNVLVNQRALVRLIDCDSFQVSAGGKNFLCEVGVAHYTPPELQGQNFRAVTRTLNHDRFGLAVLLFQLLFVGRHPYAGVYLGKGDLPFEDAISQYRFAYGPRHRAVQMAPPPFTPLLTDVTPELSAMFCRAFEVGSESPNARPTADEWRGALNRLLAQLQSCPADPGHESLNGATGCVWCRIAGSRGPDYFFGVGDSPTVFTVCGDRIDGYLARLQAARLVDFPYDRMSYAPASPPEPEPPPEDLETHRTLMLACAGATALGVVLVFLGAFSRFALLTGVLVSLMFGLATWGTVAWSPYRKELNRRRAILRRATWHLDEIEAEWESAVNRYIGRHAAFENQVRDTANRCRNLANQYHAERHNLESRREELARVQFLRCAFIADADIPGIKEGRKQTLAAYNILTAYDVNFGSVMQIKGFGEKLAGSLVAWREQVERGFRFDRSTGVPEADLRGLASKYRREQETLLRSIQSDVDAIERLAPQVRNDLVAIVPKLRAAVADWLQAYEDVRVLRTRS
jgi:DNA-binding helix-hairpin-helix protein with protein kinase domain